MLSIIRPHRCQVQGATQTTTTRFLELKLYLRAIRIGVRVILPVAKINYTQAIFAGHGLGFGSRREDTVLE